MAKIYNGQVKYLGDGSFSQQFKEASVEIKEENGTCVLRTRLKCNPQQTFRAHEVLRADVTLKGNRLLIKFAGKKGDVGSGGEMHFISRNPQVTKNLAHDVTTAQTRIKTSRQQQSKAEVHSSGKVGLPVRSLPAHRSPPDGQPSPAPVSSTKHQVFQFRGFGHQNVKPIVEKERPRTVFSKIQNEDEEDKENLKRPLSFESNDDSSRIVNNAFYANRKRKSTPQKCLLMYTPTKKELTPIPPKRSPTSNSTENRLSDYKDIISPQHTSVSLPVEIDRGLLENYPSGFPNVGLTCYLNATLQALLALRPFESFVNIVCSLSDVTHSDLGIYGYLENLRFLSKNKKCSSSDKYILMSDIIEQMVKECFSSFKLHQQEDAHEYLLVLFRLMKSHLPTIFNGCHVKYDRFFTGTFEAKILSTFQCQMCSHCIPRTDSTECLSVDIPLSASRNCRLSTSLSVQTLVDDLFDDEELEHTCGKCQHTKTIRSSQIVKPPNCLIVHVKRYTYNEEGSLKVDVDVQLQRFLHLRQNYPYRQQNGTYSDKENNFFEPNCDYTDRCAAEEKENFVPGKEAGFSWSMGDFEAGPCPVNEAEEGSVLRSYRLVSIVSHLGESPNSGHYVSDVLTKENRWITYDDTFVTLSSEDAVFVKRRASSYLLFYMERQQWEAWASESI